MQAFFRTATATADVVVIPEGTKIFMFLGAATRDPTRWTDPDRFGLTRTPQTTSVSAWASRCVGQHVGHLEAESPLDSSGYYT